MMIGLNLGLNYYRKAVSGGLSPFGGTYTWWANINDALFSDSGGTDYIDSVPLTGIVDSLVQPTAVNRPEYVVSGLDSNATMKASVIILQPQVIYKAIDASVFNTGVGTFAFVGKMDSGGVTRTFFSEAEANASVYNFQIFRSSSNLLVFYTDADGSKTLDTFINDEFAVHHFTLQATSLKYYKNGALVSTYTITQNMNTSRPLTAFGYKSNTAERGIGQIGDTVALTGTALDDTQISDDYINFWKSKYPSLP